jgi:hypothetical protein
MTHILEVSRCGDGLKKSYILMISWRLLNLIPASKSTGRSAWSAGVGGAGTVRAPLRAAGGHVLGREDGERQRRRQRRERGEADQRPTVRVSDISVDVLKSEFSNQTLSL